MNGIDLEFNVPGAGKIRISKEPHAWTGQAVGFSFGVSWGRNEYSGGVLGRNEALRLANHIIKECAKCELTEEEECTQNYIRFENS